MKYVIDKNVTFKLEPVELARMVYEFAKFYPEAAFAITNKAVRGETINCAFGDDCKLFLNCPKKYNCSYDSLAGDKPYKQS